MEIDVPKLLGGVANGQDVPPDWTMVSEWVVPGTEAKSLYEKRAFIHGADRFLVWTDMSLSEDAFQALIFWHRETHRSELLSSQREFLREGMAAAKSYNQVITAIGFAGLFAIWTQMKVEFTPLTSFAAVLMISIALVCFVGWEIFGMVVRTRANLSVAAALSGEDANAMTMLAEHRRKMHGFIERYGKASQVVIAVAVVAGAAAGLVMLSAIVHGAWLAAHGGEL